ncbi:hypothetical protein, partial [Klebsiella sp. E-Nf3]|uniref:hypothetical protein n=1 Tax=Klebsiella sp. E-Nf3 TaxID=2054603 RepID=UPI00197EE395
AKPRQLCLLQRPFAIRTFPNTTRYVIETECECVFKVPENHPFMRHSAIGIMTKPCSHHYGVQHTQQ